MRVPSWPMCIGGILLVNFIGVAIILFFAIRDPSFAVEPAYYEQALAWDEHREQMDTNETLGWSVELSQRAEGEDPAIRTITLELRDREGGTVGGAAIRFTAFHAARAGEKFEGTFGEVGGGAYESTLMVGYPGPWIFRLECVRGEDVYTEQADLRIVPSAAGR